MALIGIIRFQFISIIKMFWNPKDFIESIDVDESIVFDKSGSHLIPIFCVVISAVPARQRLIKTG